MVIICDTEVYKVSTLGNKKSNREIQAFSCVPVYFIGGNSILLCIKGQNIKNVAVSYFDILVINITIYLY